MANEMTIGNAQIPAHLQGRIGTPSALTKSLGAGLSTGEAVPRISIKGSRFRIVEDGAETVLPDTTIDVVIVGANPRLSKTYYAKPWDPDDEPAGPDCYALDGISPDISVTTPMNDLCATCEFNAWGSKLGPQGQKLKACTDQKRLAVVAADDPEGSIYLLSVTPAALKGLNQYQKDLAVRGIPAEIVRTRVTFDTDASFPKLMFKFGGFLDADTQAVVDTLFDDPMVRTITGEHVEAPDAPAAPAAKAAPEPEPEPAKKGFGRKAAPEPAPAAKAAPEPEPEPAKKGFGVKRTTTAAKAAPEPEPKAEEKPIATDDLAAEIAKMIAGGGADD